jgi:RES domain-containing protein
VAACAGASASSIRHANGVAPAGQALFRLELPDELTIAHAGERGLAPLGRDDLALRQAFGNQRLDRADELALRVPSYVEPAEHNLPINPEHPRIREVRHVIEREPFEFDPRLT